MREALERTAWDGEWYRRAFFDDATPLGSQTNDECQIDSLTQLWAVIRNTTTWHVHAIRNSSEVSKICNVNLIEDGHEHHIELGFGQQRSTHQEGSEV